MEGSELRTTQSDIPVRRCWWMKGFMTAAFLLKQTTWSLNVQWVITLFLQNERELFNNLPYQRSVSHEYLSKRVKCSELLSVSNVWLLLCSTHWYKSSAFSSAKSYFSWKEQHSFKHVTAPLPSVGCSLLGSAKKEKPQLFSRYVCSFTLYCWIR